MRPGHGWRGRRRRRHPGLRARLTRMFALVAVLAVLLTTFLTVGASFRVIAALNPELGFPAGWSGRGGVDPSTLDPQTLARWREVGRAVSRNILGSALQAAGLSALLAVIVASLVTRQLTRPLARLAEGAARLQGGERGLQLPVPRRHDELRDLTLAFNELTTSLARQEAWRRGLVADIAHDLRTPLSVMRSEIEAMQDGLHPLDAAGLARLHGEVLLLARLVTDLRLLSLAEGGALSLHPEPLDGGEVLRALVDTYAARAGEAGVSIHVHAPGPAPLTADPDRLNQTLRNLIDNALRYASPGRLDLGAAVAEGHTRLMVRDHGPGFRPEDLARAFERFYRADASRTRDPGGRASSGLGLAIARALTEAQGGTLTAHNHPEGGAEFTLSFPPAPSLTPSGGNVPGRRAAGR